MSAKTGRGGPGRGQGRKPLKAGEDTGTVSIRMTEAQRKKLDALGGGSWVRERIDRAKTPNCNVTGADPVGGASGGRSC